MANTPSNGKKLLVYILLMIISALGIEALVILSGSKRTGNPLMLISNSNVPAAIAGMVLLALFLLALYMLVYTLMSMAMKRRAPTALTVPVAIIAFFVLALCLSFVGSQLAKDPVVGTWKAPGSSGADAIVFYDNGTFRSSRPNATDLWGTWGALNPDYELFWTGEDGARSSHVHVDGERLSFNASGPGTLLYPPETVFTRA